jgi:hypothetical protein
MYIINIVRFQRISTTQVTILREVRYKGWLHRDITEVCEPVQGRKIPGFKNTWFGVNKTV